MKNVVCYIKNGVKSFEETDMTPFQYKYANPDKELVYAFDTETELTQNENKILEQWNWYAEKYGFSHRDRNAVMTNTTNGHKLQFIGFIPSNRKYKCRVKDLTTGKNYKMTTARVHDLLRYNTN